MSHHQRECVLEIYEKEGKYGGAADLGKQREDVDLHLEKREAVLTVLDR